MKSEAQNQLNKIKSVWNACAMHRSAWSGSEGCNRAVSKLRNLLDTVKVIWPERKQTREEVRARRKAYEALLDRLTLTMVHLRELAADHPEMGIRTAHLPSKYRRYTGAHALLEHSNEVLAHVKRYTRALKIYGYNKVSTQMLKDRIRAYERTDPLIPKDGDLDQAALETEKLLASCTKLVTQELEPLVMRLEDALEFQVDFQRAWKRVSALAEKKMVENNNPRR